MNIETLDRNNESQISTPPPMEFGLDGAPLPPHERGSAIGENWGVLEQALASGESINLTRMLEPVLANFRAYAGSEESDLGEIEANPDLQDVVSLYGSVEAAFSGDFEQSHNILNQVKSPNLRTSLESQLIAAAGIAFNRTGLTAVDAERSAQNVERVIEEISAWDEGKVPTDVIRQRSETIDLDTIGVGVNTSFGAVKSMFNLRSNGRLMNTREIALEKTSGVGSAPIENKLEVESSLGHETDNLFVPPVVYGALTDNRIDHSNMMNAYGDLLVELTDEAQAKSTYTIGDSRDMLFGRGTHIKDIKDIKVTQADAKRAYADNAALKAIDPKGGRYAYIEAQVPGITIRDVKRVTLPSIALGSPKLHDSNEVLELAASIRENGVSVAIRYDQGKATSEISHRPIGESFESYTKRMYEINPDITVVDTRNDNEKYYSSQANFISPEDALAEKQAAEAYDKEHDYALPEISVAA